MFAFMDRSHVSCLLRCLLQMEQWSPRGISGRFGHIRMCHFFLPSLQLPSHWAPHLHPPLPLILDQTTHAVHFYTLCGEAWQQFGGILTWNRSHPVTSRQLWRNPCIFMQAYLIFISAMPCWQLVPDPMDQWGLFLTPLSDTDADV